MLGSPKCNNFSRPLEQALTILVLFFLGDFTGLLHFSLLLSTLLAMKNIFSTKIQKNPKVNL